MLLKTRGIPNSINVPIIAKVSRNQFAPIEDNTILISEELPNNLVSPYKAVISSNSQTNNNIYPFPYITEVRQLEHLSEGDIVVVNPDGIINTLYRVNSNHNFLLFTERCNSNCLMCSQPPKDKNDIARLFAIHSELIPLIPKDCPELGITGGEPTLMGNHFFELLQLIKDSLPHTEVHCLTNGRSFAWPVMASRLEQINFSRLMLGIPLYADYYKVHDYIVQAKDAFNQTILGLYKLAEVGQRIEIRVVLHQQTIPRLVKLAKFIYKNLPFVEHVTFMGLENQGYTPHNRHLLWIDPVDYMNELSEAVHYLSQMGMQVSIYNSQLCLMPESLWQFNKRSISDWKNIYLQECRDCAKVNECGGLFASSANMHSNHITAFS